MHIPQLPSQRPALDNYKGRNLRSPSNTALLHRKGVPDVTETTSSDDHDSFSPGSLTEGLMHFLSPRSNLEDIKIDPEQQGPQAETPRDEMTTDSDEVFLTPAGSPRELVVAPDEYPFIAPANALETTRKRQPPANSEEVQERRSKNQCVQPELPLFGVPDFFFFIRVSL